MIVRATLFGRPDGPIRSLAPPYPGGPWTTAACKSPDF